MLTCLPIKAKFVHKNAINLHSAGGQTCGVDVALLRSCTPGNPCRATEQSEMGAASFSQYEYRAGSVWDCHGD